MVPILSRAHASVISLAIIGLIILLGISSCQQAKNSAVLSPENLSIALQEKLIEAQSGDIITLPEGSFSFKRSISLNDTPDITIRGAGKDKTILSFKDQIEGAEGLLIKNVNGITLEGFTVSDSKGDAIKVQDCSNVIMRDLKTTWTTGKSPDNGAYGLYPVSSTNILMEKCEASFAMDAGIYVGQSQNVVVRDNFVHNNVAGDLPQANGDRIKFYNNTMEDNNGENFAPEGMVVSTIPAGTGMIIMSHSNIEAHDNIIKGHNTIGIAINSWLFTGVPYESEAFDPFCTNINVHDNIIENGDGPVDVTSDYGQLLTAVAGGKNFEIALDGIYKPGTETTDGRPTTYCLRNNGTPTFINLNVHLGNAPEQIAQNLDHDLERWNCILPDFDTEDHDDWLTSVE